jgi:hypothetical protein
MSPSSISCEYLLSRAKKKTDPTTHEFAFLIARKPLKLAFLTLVVIVVVQLL